MTGDVEAGFKEADQIVEFDWAQSLMASHMPNPNGSVAWWEQQYLGSEGPTLFIEGVFPTWGSFELRPMYNVTYDSSTEARHSRAANTATGCSAAPLSLRRCWPEERDDPSDA